MDVNIDLTYIQNISVRSESLGMATRTRLTGYSLERPIIEYQNRYSDTRKTFFYENNDKIFRTINN